MTQHKPPGQRKEPNHLLGEKPKGVGLNKKTLSLLMELFFGILVTGILVALITRYHDQHDSDKPTEPPSASVGRASSAALLIDRLGRDQSYGVATDFTQKTPAGAGVETPEDRPSTASTSHKTDHGLSVKEFNQGAKSPLSITLQNPQTRVADTRASPANRGEASATSGVENAAIAALNNLSSTASAGPYGESYQQQNQQRNKTAFLQTKKGHDGFYLDSKLTKPRSPYEVKAGTVIAATLVTGINSDLPGQMSAKVSRNIYDTVTGNHLLIPQGATLIGGYDSQVAYGQSRVLIAWSRLIFPNGESFDLQGQPGADLAGMSGLSDKVNNHYSRIFGSALLFSIFGAAGQLSQPQQTNDILSNQQIIYGAIGQQLSQVAAKMIQKNLNIQPTLQIRPGTQFNVLLTRDMILPGPYQWSHR